MKMYNKLVRDKIPEIIKANGEIPITRILNDEEYLQLLITKLGEEYEEFKESVSLEVLADIQEVVLALADVIDSREALEKTRVKKAKIRGAYKDKVYLERTE